MFLRNLTLCALVASTSVHATHVLNQSDLNTLDAKVASRAAVESQGLQKTNMDVVQAMVTAIQMCSIPIGATATPATPATLSNARTSQQAEQQRAAQKALQQSLKSRNNYTKRFKTKFARPR